MKLKYLLRSILTWFTHAFSNQKIVKRYAYIKRDDRVLTTVKIRHLRRFKSASHHRSTSQKRNRFWRKNNWSYSPANLQYSFARMKKERGNRDAIIAVCIGVTHKSEIWRFERANRYTWWLQTTSKTGGRRHRLDDWFDQGVEQANFKGMEPYRVR